jgi:hypothetical protein
MKRKRVPNSPHSMQVLATALPERQTAIENQQCLETNSEYTDLSMRFRYIVTKITDCQKPHCFKRLDRWV